MYLPNTMMNINPRKILHKLLLLCLLSLFPTVGFAQGHHRDTVINSGLKPTTRLGVGWAGRSFNIEAGVAMRQYVIKGCGGAGKAYYTSLGYSSSFKKEEDNIWSLKAGAEFSAMSAALGIEAKYQSNFKTNDIVLCPKAGIGALGMMAFFYGLNISFNKRPFANYGRHEFMVIVNVSPSEL